MATKKAPVKKAKVTSKKVGAKPKATKKSNVVKIKPVKSKAKALKTNPAKVVEKKAAPKSIGKVTKPFTKSELYNTIANVTELNRKQVIAVFDTLGNIIAEHLKKDGPKKFVLPGLLKLVVKNVPAKPEHEGKNPFTGEMMVFKAKPASKKVKAIALRALKNMC